ncbi:helix-turn-helix domain-containing protein [Candidatus Stoquefichus massiliensis]|uniref:helix-turn-helix domain-containing protein n=1 Tax=Candidatus Stoquefichus massiliensis TaxID=1470350 RepID=UPI0004B1D598|nr:helix-turn-helix transcriptional regulator [Candidatus Stoquefichus massiliensis]
MSHSTLAKQLKKIRIERKMSQYDVEKATGIDRTTISAYETGIREPSLNNLYKLADLYLVSLDFMCGRISKRTIDVSNINDQLYKKILALLYNHNT